MAGETPAPRALLRYGCLTEVMGVAAELLPDGVAQGRQPQARGGGNHQALPAGGLIGLEYLLPGKIQR